MERYIGTKIIEAEALQRDYKPGYKVRYPNAEGVFEEDAYESWSPVDVFDAAYRMCDAMTFGLALDAMNLGKKVRLPKWANDVFISIQLPDEHSKMTHKYFYVTSRYGLVPWIPTMVEMLAEDWQIVD